MTPNVAAFLAMVRRSEGTDQAPDPYRCCYSFKHTIVDLSDHPVITGEWDGESLPDHLCIGAGLQPGCKSTAAGAYQMRVFTWKTLKRRLALPSFAPTCQDDAAAEDINSIGGIALINAGRIEEAIQVCRGIWASLPGNPAHQPQRSMDELIAMYRTQEGATLA